MQASGPLPAVISFNVVRHARHVLVVQGLGAALLARHLQSVGESIDGDHPLGAEQEGAPDGKQSDRTAAPDGDRVTGLDVAHLSAHVSGRQDVRQKQHLFVGQAAVDLERPDVGKRHACELGLAAGEPAGQVRIAEGA